MTEERVRRVTMPKWGLSMKQGTITGWLVAEGDTVDTGDDLADIDTDKIAGTLESSHAGVLRRIVADAGSAAPVGATIAVVAPAEVPDAEVEEVTTAARAEIASGALDDEPAGPAERTVEVGGRTIAVASLGEGDATPVVLVHGYGGDANSWLFVQEPLAGDRPVHALHLPGHGTSGKDVGDGSLATLAAAVTGFLDAAGIARAHLVGHSLGGAVIVAAARDRPSLAASLTLVAPAGFGPSADAEYLRGFAAAASRRELKPLLGRLFADPSQVNRQLVDDVLKYKRLDGVDACLRALLPTLLTDDDAPAIDGPALLSGVTAPVAVVWGAADRILPPPSDATPGAVFRLVPDAGHMVHMEKPADVREVIAGNLARA